MENIFRSMGNGLLLATHVLANNKNREIKSMPKYKKISRSFQKFSETNQRSGRICKDKDK